MRNQQMIRNLTMVALAVMSMTVTVLAANRRTTLPYLQLGAEWSERRFDSTPTRYIELDENGSKVVMAASVDSASALWVPMETALSEKVELSWRWKVTRRLSNHRERLKSGDDYAARVFVGFDDDPFSRDSRSLCYVWASKEPVGAVYPSPYSPNVMTIVLRNGKDGTGEWASETRNIVEDFQRAFGTSPRTLHAVAVMVDTDNTQSRATTWFSDLVLTPSGRPVTPSEEPPPADR
jgi:hypothetical protein